MRVDKILIFTIYSFLCSAIVVFFGFCNRQSVEIIETEKIIEEEKESDFFTRSSGQAIENIIFFINVGILLFFWENSKNNKNQLQYKRCCHYGSYSEDDVLSCGDKCHDNYNEIYTRICCSRNSDGSGLCEIKNWFGFGTFISFFVITLFVEFVLNPFLISPIAHPLRKDKSKNYFHTLKKIILLWERKINSEFIFNYMGFAIFIILIAKLTPRCCLIVRRT